MLVSGRSTTRPTNSALEAEAKDLRWAVLQLKRLGYEEIYILWRLIWVVPDYAKDTKETRRNRLEAVELFNHYQLAIFNSFVKNVTFVKISRKANIVMADKLAKYARTRSQNMVVSWNNDVFWFIYMKFIWREKKKYSMRVIYNKIWILGINILVSMVITNIYIYIYMFGYLFDSRCESCLVSVLRI